MQGDCGHKTKEIPIRWKGSEDGGSRQNQMERESQRSSRGFSPWQGGRSSQKGKAKPIGLQVMDMRPLLFCAWKARQNLFLQFHSVLFEWFSTGLPLEPLLDFFFFLIPPGNGHRSIGERSPVSLGFSPYRISGTKIQRLHRAWHLNQQESAPWRPLWCLVLVWKLPSYARQPLVAAPVLITSKWPSDPFSSHQQSRLSTTLRGPIPPYRLFVPAKPTGELLLSFERSSLFPTIRISETISPEKFLFL